MENGQDFSVLNRDFLEYLRKVLICKITEGQAERILTGEHKQKALDLSEKFSIADLIFTTRLYLRSFKELGSSPVAQIPLLLASLEAGLKNSPSPKQNNTKIQSPSFVSENSDKIQTKAVSENIVTKKTETQEVLDETCALQEVQLIWPKVISKVKEKNFPLANLIKNSALLDVSRGKAVLGVRFLIHKQNIENQKNSQIFKQAISEVLGKKLGVETRVIKDREAEDLKKLAPAEALADALKIFGGEIVE
ncbi:MAG: hypothetical protein NTX98_00130 [Candidatus Doudnabacteria bacterium]|nr:hypothetical protein [Candidatus Doudnabacteria bacterium]